jgi:hypothetical protein
MAALMATSPMDRDFGEFAIPLHMHHNTFHQAANDRLRARGTARPA